MQSSILNSIKELVDTAARIVKIDIDQYPNIANENGVRSVPTLMLYKKGEFLWRGSGVYDVNTLTNLIHQYSDDDNE